MLRPTVRANPTAKRCPAALCDVGLLVVFGEDRYEPVVVDDTEHAGHLASDGIINADKRRAVGNRAKHPRKQHARANHVLRIERTGEDEAERVSGENEIVLDYQDPRLHGVIQARWKG